MVSNLIDVEYQDNSSRYERLRSAVVEQVANLLSQSDLTLGVPIESRIKSLSSINEKLQRKAISLTSVSELHDLIGVRVILLFKRDLNAAVGLLRKTFDVESIEDTGKRLGDAEFGYQSQHLILKIPSTWTSVPSLSNLSDLFVEVQVRTLAQHIWAATSHKLQYKSEVAVPPPIRRAINRASALLETVDLEFDRVLVERETYIQQESKSADAGAPLNVDSLATLLDRLFPPANKSEAEPYALLLEELQKLGVSTAADFEKLFEKWHTDVVKKEASRVAAEAKEAEEAGVEPTARVARGVFFTHLGLARAVLRNEFGDEALLKLFKERIKTKKASPRRSARANNSVKPSPLRGSA
ncbi:MAG: hypothetical protein O9331_06390 [Acidovorax sp.]|nr:hypothetical protein [Acidovorax sp.]